MVSAGVFGLVLCHDVLFTWPVRDVSTWVRAGLGGSAARQGCPRCDRETGFVVPPSGEWPAGSGPCRGLPALPALPRPALMAAPGLARAPGGRRRPVPAAAPAHWTPAGRAGDRAGRGLPARRLASCSSPRARSRSRTTRPRSTPAPCSWSGPCSTSATRSASSRSTPGPVITQFEIELEAGLRVSRIMSLADDLAIALAVPSVRIVAPIPGKTTVGIEVPNDRRGMVRLGEVIAGVEGSSQECKIPLFLGKDVKGQPLVVRPGRHAPPADRRPDRHGQVGLPERDDPVDPDDQAARRGEDDPRSTPRWSSSRSSSRSPT